MAPTQPTASRRSDPRLDAWRTRASVFAEQCHIRAKDPFVNQAGERFYAEGEAVIAGLLATIDAQAARPSPCHRLLTALRRALESIDA